MRKFAIALATAATLISAPAFAQDAAGQARVEARGGIVFDGDDSDAIAGIAAGYDFDLGSSAFVGGEVTADKILADDTDITLGFNGRLGAKLAGGTKLYGIGGYQTKPCDLCEESWTAGAGAEVPFGQNLYGKVEYRHFFVGNGFSDYDAAVAGIGVRF